MKVSVIVPTRNDPNPVTGRPYFERAVASVEGQLSDLEIAAMVGFDPSPVPLGQARAVNEAVARADGDLLAFLEDDDTWDPQKLATQLPFLDRFDLVTCNQREVDETGAFVRISYYPTPSGWLMRRSTWDFASGDSDEGLALPRRHRLAGTGHARRPSPRPPGAGGGRSQRRSMG